MHTREEISEMMKLYEDFPKDTLECMRVLKLLSVLTEIEQVELKGYAISTDLEVQHVLAQLKYLEHRSRNLAYGKLRFLMCSLNACLERTTDPVKAMVVAKELQYPCLERDMNNFAEFFIYVLDQVAPRSPWSGRVISIKDKEFYCTIALNIRNYLEHLVDLI